MIQTLAVVFLILFLIALTLAVRWRLENKQLAMVLALHRSITPILDPALSIGDAAPLILEALCRSADFQAACFFLADTERGVMRCAATWTDESSCDEFCAVSSMLVVALGTGIPGSVLASGTPLVISDLARERNFVRAAAAESAGLHSAVMLPVQDDGGGVAVIELFRHSNGQRGYLTPALQRIAGRVALLMKWENRQRRITASEVELRTVIDTAPDGIVYLDSAGRVESINKAAVTLLGYTREEIVGNSVLDFLPDVYRHKLGSAVKYYFRSSVSGLIGRATEVTGQRKDGSTFPLEISVGRLMVGEREIFTGIIRDITDRKLLEKRLGEFYSTVSHELRSPLSSIRGSLGLIEGGAVGDVSPDVLELIQIARKNCDRLIRLINDILDAKKIEAGKLQMASDILDAGDIILSAIEGLQSFAFESHVSLVALPTASPSVMGDEDRIVQVLTNLLSNAIKYAPPGSQVDVFTTSAANGGGFVRFCVLDRGPGVPSDELAKLFSEFQQLDSSDSRAKGGTGLGLAISKRIVEQMGGQIGVDNRAGQGSTFWFELPVA